MTASEKRRLLLALRDYRNGHADAVVREVCRQLDVEMPEVTRQRMLDDAQRTEEQRAVERALTRPVHAQPKPQKRIVDDAVLAAYVEAHQSCEVLGCQRAPAPTPHHLVSRKMHGDDTPGNLIRVCAAHHRAWHEHGGRSWLFCFAAHLTAETRSKVETALRLTAIAGVAKTEEQS